MKHGGGSDMGLGLHDCFCNILAKLIMEDQNELRNTLSPDLQKSVSNLTGRNFFMQEDNNCNTTQGENTEGLPWTCPSADLEEKSKGRNH